LIILPLIGKQRAASMLVEEPGFQPGVKCSSNLALATVFNPGLKA
jgi:hypothetical protein